MSSNPPHALFVISVAAELSGLHPQTLRIYERRGLVEPHRTPGGTRRYSQADIDRLQLIQTLTEQGLNLEGVKKVMDLQNRIVALEREIGDLNERLSLERERANAAIRNVHASYRSEIVVRKSHLPDRNR
ncbi:MAG: helix-turn-helix transcriptional regulator [Acidimicrobiia bacterium]|nr:helix-turn-helix transcriptional regulator [Acidimicrobiia bacterium]